MPGGALKTEDSVAPRTLELGDSTSWSPRMKGIEDDPGFPVDLGKSFW